jgi:hypothetical protein
MLDEVVLGLSAEPLVYGALRPQMHAVLYGRALFNWPRFPSGYEAHPWDWISAYLGSILWALVALILMPFRPIAWIWERYMAKKLIQLISSPAFGLQADEFVGAAILARPQLALPWFFKEYDWDVTELLICSPSVERNTSEDRRARYAFLWNEAELNGRLSGSWLWKQRELWKNEIRSYYSPFQAHGLGAFDDQQKKACLILEERLRELVGVVKLIHSSYYTNPEIIPAIARFIATREPPESSRPLQAG